MLIYHLKALHYKVSAGVEDTYCQKHFFKTKELMRQFIRTHRAHHNKYQSDEIAENLYVATEIDTLKCPDYLDLFPIHDTTKIQRRD